MYEIVYLPIAREDLNEIILYISGQLKAPQAAMDLLDALDHSISLLAEFPYTYRLFQPLKSLSEEYRMLTIKNYAVFFVVREPLKLVEIHRIVYARMDLNQMID